MKNTNKEVKTWKYNLYREKGIPRIFRQIDKNIKR